MKNRQVDKALSAFEMNFNCCQSVLSACADAVKIDKDTSLMLASGFGGGMSRQGNTCGAVVGAYMAIGLLVGNTNPDDESKKEIVHNLITEFNKDFIRLNKYTNCRELLGKDMSKPDELEYLRENKIFANRCPKFVGDASKILDEIIKKYNNGK